MATKRRTKGEGSIVQRKSGFWQFSLDLGKDEAGKRQRLHLYAPTRPKLLKKIADERARNGGTFRPRDQTTVADWVTTWLASKKASWSPNTHALNETAWLIHAKPLIGHLRLETFNADNVRAAYASLTAKKVGGRMVQVVGKLMRAAFAQAEKEGKVHRNPWELVEIPKHETKPAHALTTEEAQRFIEATQGERYEALFLIYLFAGLRLAEGLGLKWSDLSFQDGTIKIERQLTETNGSQAVGPLKTKASYRTVNVGESVLAALRRRLEAAKGEGHDKPFIFTLADGTHPKRKAIALARKRIAKAAGIADLHPHDLRHSNTSHKAAANVPAVDIQAGGGWSSNRMPGHYSHSLPGQQAEAARLLEERFSKRVVK